MSNRNRGLTGKDIIETMNYIEDEYIESALKRLGYTNKVDDTERKRKDLEVVPYKKQKSKSPLSIIMKRVAVFIGATVLITSTTVATAMAVNEDFREIVKEILFNFLHIEEEEVVPELPSTEEVTIDTMYVEPDRSILGGVIEGRYVHTPVSSHAREGIYTICTDEIEMNQGSHYDAYYEENGDFIKLEEYSFRGDYTVLGQDFHLEFDWAVHNGQVSITYVDVEESYRIPANPGNSDAMLVELLCSVNTEAGEMAATAYPVFINLENGELMDVLAGTGAETLGGLCNQAVSEDGSKMLLARRNGALYYVDLEKKKLYSVEELSGEKADACSLIGNMLSCWVMENDSFRAWTIDLTSLERKELFSGIPNAMGGDKSAGMVYLFGFDTNVHWGTMFTGSHFALKTDALGNVTVIDLATGEEIPVEGFTWPADKYTDILWEISPDGKRLLISGGEIGLKYEYIGLLDFEKMQYLEFERVNPNEVYEWKPYWFDKDTVIIQATSKDSYYVQDYYVYDIQEEPVRKEETSVAETGMKDPEPVQEPLVQEPADEEFVRIIDYIPDAMIELRYATENNFTSQIIYDFEDAWLRYGTVKKIMKVQEELKESGLGLKVWDAFRPPAAQFALWEAYPDATYVSDPNKGYSSHSKGNTIDVTLVNAEGIEATMPTDYDDFTAMADRDYSDCTVEAAENAMLLEKIMVENGFKPYQGEWWHYSDNDSYHVEDSFYPTDRRDQ